MNERGNRDRESAEQQAIIDVVGLLSCVGERSNSGGGE
jgi:hypothetical protein